MKRILIASTIVATSLFAISAGAATSITISSDKPIYLPGETITLTVTGTADAGETDNTLFGGVVYDQTKVTIASQVQNVVPGAGWVTGALTCTTIRCIAFSQINSIAPAAINVADFVVATQKWDIAIDVPGGTVLNFGWQTTPTTQHLDWFGITVTSQSAPNGLKITVVPEPATGALLALGILGLGLAGRRRA